MLTLLMSINSWGAKAFPGPYTFTQPDGTKLSVTLHGDEHFSYYTTLDGVILVREGDTFYIAEISDEGDIKATGVLAHNNGERSSSEIALIQQQDKGKLFNRNTIKRTIRKVTVADGDPKYTPHTGSPNIVVILAEFQDVKFSVNEPADAFNELFNATKPFNDYGNHNTRNIGSVRQYFKTMSSNDFTPNFKIVGPVTLSQNRKYYGGSNKAPNDENSAALAEEAAESVMELGLADLNSDEYDADDDGNVDLVYIIYAGHMQNMGGPNESVWAKASYTDHSIGTKKVRRYCMSGELLHPNASGYIASIGVICHEFSHCLGLPDLYVTSEFYADNQEMELWDLMDGGENLHNGWQPAAYTAWEKEAMDWPVKIQNLSAENSSGDLSRPTTDGGTVYRIVNPDDANEYIMLENIKKEGWNYGCYIPDEINDPSYTGYKGGILAYHMKYPNSTVSMGDDPNCQPNPALAVIPADGLLESIDLKDQIINGVLRTDDTYKNSHKGDLFNNVNGLQISDELNLPNFCWYSGSETIAGYADRYKTNMTVSFTFEGDNITVNYMERMVLDENSTNLPDAATDVNVRVKRAISAGNWSTICLPFAMTEEQCKEAFGPDVLIADFTGTESVCDEENNVVGIKAGFQSVTSMEKNHPYIIKVKEKITEFTADGVNIEPDEGACIEFDNGETGTERVVYSGFYGTYKANTVLDEFTLFLSDNKFYYSAGKTKMKAYRAYFEFLDILTDVKENAGAKIAFMMDYIPTHIEGFAADKVYLEGAVYTIGGQLVGKDVNMNQLKKGVYIRNGKKFVVK